MHVISFPVMHCFLAFLVYTVSGILSGAEQVSRVL